ncbi:MAG: hypothetical protein E6G56_01420 [Actinobacteria bacterium]|nr:MAG: hypothetical protein E6G56_01420 [Actinomycetota bacterium]
MDGGRPKRSDQRPEEAPAEQVPDDADQGNEATSRPDQDPDPPATGHPHDEPGRGGEAVPEERGSDGRGDQRPR